MDFFTNIIESIEKAALFSGAIAVGMSLVAGGAAFLFGGLGALGIAQAFENMFSIFK